MSRATPIPDWERVTTRTPWGPAQARVRYGHGVNLYTTAGHGGFKVANGLNAQVHPAWRCADGWYEEDCDWAIVALTFQDLFTADQLRLAHESARRWHAERYELAMAQTDAGGFYVSVVADGWYHLALGPFDTKDDAEAQVAAVRRYCFRSDPRAAFWGYGTCRVLTEADRTPGKLNAALRPDRAPAGAQATP